MPLTESELELIQQGIQLAVAAVLAEVQAAGKANAPIDWASLRITDTPETALAKARERVTNGK